MSDGIDINVLLFNEKQLEEKLVKTREMIRLYREVCEHDFQHIGNNSHYYIYKCTKCGEIDRQ